MLSEFDLLLIMIAITNIFWVIHAMAHLRTFHKDQLSEEILLPFDSKVEDSGEEPQ